MWVAAKSMVSGLWFFTKSCPQVVANSSPGSYSLAWGLLAPKKPSSPTAHRCGYQTYKKRGCSRRYAPYHSCFPKVNHLVYNSTINV